MGLTQELLAAMVAHTAPADLRGTAFGFFNLPSDRAPLIANPCRERSSVSLRAHILAFDGDCYSMRFDCPHIPAFQNKPPLHAPN
jgi:hypothetical protein